MAKPISSPVLGRLLDDGAPFIVDVGALSGYNLSVAAQAGGGKSYLLRKLLEVTAGRVQQIVLDVEDEYYTLREAMDVVIAGGENGDCPATVENAPALARALLENGLSAVVQMNGLGREGARAFVAKFLAAMIEAPSELWHPVLVVLDEAHRFAPQSERVESSDAVVDFASRGRKRGFSLALATQRLSKLDKNATADCPNWLLGKVGQSVDRRSVADALGFPPSSKEARELQALDRGQFWAFGPALCPTPMLVDVDAVRTTHLQAGTQRAPTPPAPAKLKRIFAALTAAAEAVAAPEASTQAAVAPVTTRGPGLASPAPDPVAIAAAEQRGYERGYAAAARFVADEWRAYVEQLREGAREALHAPWPARVEAQSEEPPVSQPERIDHPAARLPPTPEPVQAHSLAEAGGSAAITPARQRILDAIAWAESALRTEGPSREVVAFLSGASPNSSSFANNLGALRSAGLIEYPRAGILSLTSAGRAQAAEVKGLLTHEALFAAIRGHLAPAQARVLSVVCDSYPHARPRTEVADSAGASASSSSFSNNLGRLSSLGLITYPGPGKVRAADFLFPETRA